MITLGMFGNLALLPMDNFTGVFERNKMKEYNVRTKATVLFTQNHLITSATNMVYFIYVSNHHCNKK